MDNGKTALIEMNDGFGLGAYDIEPYDYGRLVETRWSELINTIS